MIDESFTDAAIAWERKKGLPHPEVAVTPAMFIPQRPTARQKLFLDLKDKREVFYGGAAGGGKSSALLMAALEYIDVPGYSALILRKTYADLAKPGALLDRAQQWLRGKAHWSDKNKTWTFPSGATLSFGYIDAENDKFNFQGAEFQFIGFDETSQFTKSQYAYLFSRLRRLKGSDVPIRMRAASNPGGLGAAWVYERFIPEGFVPDDAIEEKVWTKIDVDEETGDPIERYFVPARLDDNPHLDQAEYEQSLRELDPVTRAQLRRGDWQITVRGDILYMWSEPHVIITWSEFENVFKSRYIPLHWKLGVFQDWGTTEGHPCVTMWFATAGMNAPEDLAGSIFCYRSMLETQCTATEVKVKIKDHMQLHNERPRVAMWEMSHEASSERLEYNRVTVGASFMLPFHNWETGKTRGIEQLKNAITIRDDDKLHPFKANVYGRPKMYFIVNDDQAMNPRDEGGMLRIRQEAPAYKWATPKSGDVAANLVPYALFNDAIDVIRAACATYFPKSVQRTTREQIAYEVEKISPMSRIDDMMMHDLPQVVAMEVTARMHLEKEVRERVKIANAPPKGAWHEIG